MTNVAVSTPPTVGGYSFYLNVVVIGSNGQNESLDEGTNDRNSSPGEVESSSVATEPTEAVTIEVESADIANQGTENGLVVASQAKSPKIDPTLKLMMDTRSLCSAFTKRNFLPKSDSGPGMFSSIGKSISKRSKQISEGASRMVANKTMVSRAERAVVECIPFVTDEIGVEMSISKRFQQGPVFVLEVDMKGCDLLELLEKVLGTEAAEHYRKVTEGLEALELPHAKEAFIKEILPKVRKGMMCKTSEIVPEKMKLKKNYADLEIQCVALEDAEEAKWLYNFLAFMEEMK